MPILKPRYWIPRARLSIAMSSYPIYTPPHRAAEFTLSEKEASENFSHFIETSDERVNFLTEWLKSYFGVYLDYSKSGILSMQYWINMCGGSLIGGNRGIWSSYINYAPRWVDDFRSCNIIYDIGTYIGNYLIVKRPFLKWEMIKGTSFESFDRDFEYYNKPGLVGSYYPVGDPLSCALHVCHNLSNNIYIGDSMHRSDNYLKRFIQSALHISSYTPENVPETVGDISNEPLE